MAATLISITPNSAAAGAPDTTIALVGTSFTLGSTATFAGTDLLTTFTDSTHLSALVPASLLTTPGIFPVDVEIPFPNGHSLNLVTLSGVGLTDYAFNNAPTLPNVTTGITSTFWFKIAAPLSGNEKVVLGHYDPNVGLNWWVTLLPDDFGLGPGGNNAVVMHTGGNSGVSGPHTQLFRQVGGGQFSTGVWHSVQVVCVAGVGSSAWLDGHPMIPDNTSPPAIPFFNNGNVPISIGATPLGLLGAAPILLDEITIFINTLKTGADALRYSAGPIDMSLEAGITDWWRWENTAVDSVGPNDMTFHGGTIGYSPDAPFGAIDPSDVTNSLPFTVTTGVYVVPARDTIRGGKTAIVYGLGPYNGVSLALRDNVLPAGWSSSHTGSGSVSTSALGISLSSGVTANSSATVTVPTTLDGFDAAIDIVAASPRAALSAPYDIASLEFVGVSGAVSQVALRFDPAISTTNTIAICTTSGGTVLGGGGVVLGPRVTSPVSLRLVRVQGRAFAFIGTRGVTGEVELDTWLSLTSVGQVLAPVETGTLRIVTRNLANASLVSTRITNFTTRWHAIINGRLLEDKTVSSPRRIAGSIPAAGLSDVGDTVIQAFGPGVAGTENAAFEYTLPSPLTTGRQSFDQLLRIYTDTALYDNKG